MVASLELLPWSNKDRRFFLSREEEYIGALRAATQIWLRMADGELTVEDALLMRQLIDWPGGLELHIGVWSYLDLIFLCADH
jgi:acyl-CoA oxidase